MQRNNAWKHLKFDENYKLIDTRSLIKPMHKEHKENYFQLHHNQVSQTHKKIQRHSKCYVIN